MPFRTKNTVSVPGKGTYNFKKKTFTGKGPAPEGYKKTREKSYTEVPTVTVESDGEVTASGYSSPKAAATAVKRQRADSKRTARKLKRIKRQQVVRAGRETRKERVSALDSIADIADAVSGVLGDGASAVGKAPDLALKGAQTAALAAYELPRRKTSEAFGKPTLGTPTVGQVFQAKKQGTLKVNKAGKVTIPATRKAARELTKAKKVYRAKAKPKVSGLLNSDQERFAIALSKETKIPLKLASEWVLQESGASSAGVGGEAGEHNQLGVGYPAHPTSFSQSPYFNNTTPEKAAKATADWMKGKIGAEYDYAAADSIKGIPSLAEGGASEAEIRAYIEGPSAWGTGQISQSGIAVSNTTPNPKVVRRLRRAKKGAKQLGIPLGPKGGTPTSGPERVALWGGKKRGKIEGEIAGVTPEVAALGRAIAGQIGKPINVISGNRPGSITTSGNVSDHSSGNALDIDALDQSEGGGVQGEREGDAIAKAAARVAGLGVKSPEFKEFLAGGGVYEGVSPSGYRVQILWKTDVGGNHHNHVHVGIRAEEGAASIPGSASSVGSSGGTSGSYVSPTQVSAYADATGKSPAKVGKELLAGKLTVEDIRAKKLKKIKGVRNRYQDRKEAIEDVGNADSLLDDLVKKYGSPAV